MDLSAFKGNGVLFFSDPAGAKACLALVEIIKSAGEGDIQVKLYSNKYYEFYKDWSTPVILSNNIDEIFSGNIDWVFAATSHPESSNRYEIMLMQEAGRRTILTSAFIDHWTCMKLRFEIEENVFYFPNQIIVVDEFAKKIALEDGLPESKLIIQNNPYLDYIRNYWKPSRSKAAILNQIGNYNTESPVILYAPDPLSLRVEDKIWGFNEADALDTLINVLVKNNIPLYIKQHPLQPQEILNAVIAKYPEATVINVAGVDNLELMFASDIIIGFHSNFLLEAMAMGKNTLRYQIGLKCADSFKDINFGDKINNINDLEEMLKEIKPDINI